LIDISRGWIAITDRVIEAKRKMGMDLVRAEGSDIPAIEAWCGIYARPYRGFPKHLSTYHFRLSIHFPSALHNGSLQLSPLGHGAFTIVYTGAVEHLFLIYILLIIPPPSSKVSLRLLPFHMQLRWY